MRREREERGPWYLLTGLVIGVMIGVLYAWFRQPVEYTNTTPASLRADFKDQYRTLIALAYMASGDLLRAQERLKLLKDDDPYQTLAEQAQRTLAGGGSMQEARALGVLAVALGQPPATLPAAAGGTPITTPVDSSPTVTATLTPTLGTPSPQLSSLEQTATAQAGRPRPTDTPTITPLPTRTASPTPGSLFALKSEELVCDPQQSAPLIAVQAYDAAGQGVPGVEIVVGWDGGEDGFFTGLKAELGLGYADFSMSPGVVYNLRLAEGGQIIPNLTSTECEGEDGERYWGTWLLIFQQP